VDFSLLARVLRRRAPAKSALFPYTTLFRSECRVAGEARHQEAALALHGRVGRREVGQIRHRNAEEFELGVLEIEHLLGLVMDDRSEEHTSELQSREKLVCRLLLEKKK